ncbi:MAG: hypothetical protein ACAH07_06050 [Methylophilaceae bacterium]|nr:hypothetical protein [Methyloradius sp.]
MKTIGQTFSKELESAGLLGLPFSWGADGTFTFSVDITAGQKTAIKAVYDAHDPDASLVTVPQSVSRLQALVALDLAGHLDAIESYMAEPTTPRLQKLAWENAQDFTRESPTVAALALMLGLSASDVDQLFINASQVVA